LADFDDTDVDGILIVDALLDNPTVTIDEETMTAAVTKLSNNEKILLSFIEKRPFSINEAMVECAMKNQVLLDAILGRGSDNHVKQSCMFHAIQEGKLEAIKALLRQDPDLSTLCKDSRPLLALASEHLNDDSRVAIRETLAPYIIRRVRDQGSLPDGNPQVGTDTTVQGDGAEEDTSMPVGIMSVTDKIRFLLAEPPGKALP
jgi:hypothetical protein